MRITRIILHHAVCVPGTYDRRGALAVDDAGREVKLELEGTWGIRVARGRYTTVVPLTNVSEVQYEPAPSAVVKR